MGQMIPVFEGTLPLTCTKGFFYFPPLFPFLSTLSSQVLLCADSLSVTEGWVLCLDKAPIKSIQIFITVIAKSFLYCSLQGYLHASGSFQPGIYLTGKLFNESLVLRAGD
jgi:hypothetical protein